ncbi:MAG: AAA family ATPase [Okeania sp. SIO3C4]|nr:AAA family ATPase [Okeania sp. SIO3C4]
MRIGKLHFKNFRGFEDFELDLSENRLAVFVGENGSGKSTVLEGIRLLLTSLFYRLPVIFEGDDFGTVEFEPELSLTLNDLDKKHFQVNSTGDESEILNKVKYEESFPIFRFFSSNHDSYTLGDNSNSGAKNKLTFLQHSIAFNPSSSKEFFAWFSYHETIENEIRLNEDNSYRCPYLEPVRVAIKTFFKEEIIQSFRFSRISNTEFIIKQNNKEFRLEKLSSGTAYLFSLICNISSLLSVSNQKLENPLEGEGIVMIDEIDSHLHPKWQEEIVPALLKTFPNIQFLITTHSPHVVRNIQREDLFILKDFKLEEGKPYTYAINIEDAVSSIFEQDQYHPVMKKAIREVAGLIDNEDLEKAKKKIRKLGELVGDNYPEVFRLRNEIDFWEM